MVLLAALNVAPIFTIALVRLAIMFLTECVGADEGIGAIHICLLLLLVSMLTLGSALERSGR